MMKPVLVSILIAVLSLNISASVPVTLKNYEVAESNLSFSNITRRVGMNKLLHFPVNAFDLNNQTVVRMNLDTIYSGAIVDTSEGASITLPESDGRYMSVMVVQNDHYIDQVFLGAGTYEIKSDTKFVMVVIRIQIDMNDPADGAKVEALQKATRLTTTANGSHILPDYDMEQLVALRNDLAAQAAKLGSLNNMQGARGTIDARMHLLGTAAGWGLLPDTNARYISYGQESAQGCFRANYKVPPFKEGGFFSITVYAADGWLFSDKAHLNKNNISYNDDGTFDVNFGKCKEAAVNNIPLVANWNLILRVYEPQLSALDNYTIPTPVKVD